MKTLPLAAAVLLVSATVSQAAAPVSFKKDIAPILQNNCLACHGAKKAEGGYRVDSFQRAMAEGESGTTGFTAKDLDGSESLRRMMSDDEAERMPLESDPLSKEQIELVKRWVQEGAKFDSPDPKASLASIIPAPTHPEPPAVYPSTMPITAMAFTPDGKQLLVGGYNELTVWNPVDGKLVRRIKNVGQRTYGLAVSPDGKTLAVACGAPGRLGEVRLFEPASGKLLKVLGSSGDVIFDVAFSSKGDRLASCGADGAIRIFETATGKEQLTITSHSDWVMDIAWNKDDTKLASASRDKTSKVFDVKTGELVVTYSGHGKSVKGVAFHPDGKHVYSSAADRKVQQWKIADGKKAADVTTFGGEVYKLDASGTFLFAGSADKSARQFDLATRKQVRAYAGHADWVLATAYHDGAKRLVTGTFDGEVRVWNTADGKQLLTFLAAPGYTKPTPPKK